MPVKNDNNRRSFTLDARMAAEVFSTNPVAGLRGKHVDARAVAQAFDALPAEALRGPQAVELAVQATGQGESEAVRLLLTARLAPGRERTLTATFAPATFTAGHADSDQWPLRALSAMLRATRPLVDSIRALRVGEMRLRQEIDYRKPAAALRLLRDRECEIHDAAAIRRIVEENPGPLYYGDLDLDEDGNCWELGGARWANQIEARAAELGALTPPARR